MTFADVPDDFVTDDISIKCRLGETLSVCASAGRIVVEITERGDCTNAHLTVAQAEEHIAHVQQMIAEAKRLARQYPEASVTVVPLDTFRKLVPGQAREERL